MIGHRTSIFLGACKHACASHIRYRDTTLALLVCLQVAYMQEHLLLVLGKGIYS
jgi:hypothetical protein